MLHGKLLLLEPAAARKLLGIAVSFAIIAFLEYIYLTFMFTIYTQITRKNWRVEIQGIFDLLIKRLFKKAHHI